MTPEQTPRWLFFPDYRANLPYQQELALALAPAWHAAPATVAMAVDASFEATPAVFHLGWEETVYRGAPDLAAAHQRADRFLEDCDAFTANGGQLVWTLHNAAPHENNWPELHARVQRALAARVSVAHAHGREGAALLRGFGVPEARIVVSPCPGLGASYPNHVGAEQARDYLGLDPQDFVFVNLGAARRYKGLDLLDQAFELVLQQRPGVRLVLAGKQAAGSDARYQVPSPERRVLPRYVADAEIQYVLGAADCVVLPYHRILTSGAAMLAQSFGRPLILPDVPAMREIASEAEALFHAPGDPADLARAMGEAHDKAAALRGPMREAARARAAAHTFPGLADALSAAVAAMPARITGAAPAVADGQDAAAEPCRPVQPWRDDPGTVGWVASQTNAALRDSGSAALAGEMLARAGLPPHPDRPKNWDTAIALFHALACTGVADPVLDAGAERYSSFLPALRRLGYQDLTGINLTFGEPQRENGILFRHGDVTRTRLPEAHFGFIASLSVIEHGVDPAAFLQESARLLRPGGHLFVSFDYWEDAVDTGGQVAYGTPIRIFRRDDVDAMLGIAQAAGLAPHGPCDFRCDERVVHWQRFDLRYTFANLLLRKVR